MAIRYIIKRSNYINDKVSQDLEFQAKEIDKLIDEVKRLKNDKVD